MNRTRPDVPADSKWWGDRQAPAQTEEQSVDLFSRLLQLDHDPCALPQLDVVTVHEPLRCGNGLVVVITDDGSKPTMWPSGPIN